jgi:NodT family efflux transporter outer membrane factor (OMF) lipoprotein
MKRIPCLLVLSMTACSTGTVRPPQMPAATQFTSTPVVIQGQALGSAADMPAQWWTLYQSAALDALVRQALDNSPTVAEATARLRQVQQERVARAGTAWFPRVDARLSANRIDVEPQSIGAGGLPIATPLDLYLATVSVSYNLDLFGAARHELRALQAQVDYQAFELEAARLSLAANVVTAAIREASLREQIATVGQMISLQENRLDIVAKLEQLGTASAEDVVAQRMDLAQTRVLLPELRRQLEQVRHRLAVYTGQAPGAAKLPEFRLAGLQLPAQLPLSVPAELARQRPDIRAAEALLTQAAERVGVATANLYPQIMLTATGGSISTSSGDLFGDGTLFSLLGASLTQPLFHGRELQAKRRAAIAAYEQAGAAYRQVLLQGLLEVADVLRALEADAEKVRERGEAAGQARRYRDIIAARHDAGGVSYYAMLEAERRFQSASIDHVQALADRYADSAALLQALGGGWWKEDRPQP